MWSQNSWILSSIIDSIPNENMIWFITSVKIQNRRYQIRNKTYARDGEAKPLCIEFDQLIPFVFNHFPFERFSISLTSYFSLCTSILTAILMKSRKCNIIWMAIEAIIPMPITVRIAIPLNLQETAFIPLLSAYIILPPNSEWYCMDKNSRIS